MRCLHCPIWCHGRAKVCKRCKGKHTQRTISVNAETYRAIQKAAVRLGVTMREVVEEACRV